MYRYDIDMWYHNENQYIKRKKSLFSLTSLFPKNKISFNNRQKQDLAYILTIHI